MAIAMREKGVGITNLSHLISHAREAAYDIGRIGRPDICASSRAPGLNLKRGPRGPSGVMTGETLSLRSEEHTSELQSQSNLVCRLLLEKKKKNTDRRPWLNRRKYSCSLSGQQTQSA